MTASDYSKYIDPEIRNIFPLPLAEEFYNLLQDRLFACVENNLFQGETQFILIINAVSRVEEQNVSREESPDLIYAGLEKQRELIEFGENEFNGSQQYENAWKTLSSAQLNTETSKESSSIFSKIQNGEHQIKDLQDINHLADYFADISGAHATYQEAEKIILQEFFDLKNDVFISVPLIGYGEFDGVVHIVFKKALLHKIPGYKEGDKNLSYGIVWSLIRSFIAEYDGMFLDWSYVGDDLEKVKSTDEFLQSTVFFSDEFFNQRVKNPIFRELQLRRHYQLHAQYFLKRLELSEGIPGVIYDQYITNAVTAILVDSYAHNVSAHALSTLAWWYQRRSGRLKDEEVLWESILDRLRNDSHISQDILEQFNSEIIKRRKNKNREREKPIEVRPSDGAAVVNYPGSLSRELAQLLRFLTEKGTYWSGVIRDANPGGKVSSLYSVLWYDFIRNPFFLGTIAKTEDILHIKVKVVIYEPEKGKDLSVKIPMHFSAINNGILGGVDLTNPRKDLSSQDSRTPHEEILSAFVYKGEAFDQMRIALKKIKLYFPGGVVGRHAFYTMIENEIRNIKHYPRETLLQLQKEGLIVAIGVQLCSLPDSANNELYRISVWLDVPTELQKKNSMHLVAKKWEALKGEIINKETRAPLLGGTYQDKICAGFLLNGIFSHVQRGDKSPFRDKAKDTERDKYFYPFTRPVCSPLEPASDGIHNNYRFSYTIIIDNEVDTSSFPKYGYLKKSFFMWRGEFFLDSRGGNMSPMDNPSRFLLVCLQRHDFSEILRLRREHGLVRLVVNGESTADEDLKFVNTYKLWLRKLIGNDDFYGFRAIVDDNPLYILALQNDEQGGLQFYYDDLSDMNSPTNQKMLTVMNSNEQQEDECRLIIAHRNEPQDTGLFEIRYRSHGIYATYFFQQDKIPKPLNDVLMMEFFEVLYTRVCIFDSRVHHRMRLDEENVYKIEYNTFLRNKLKLAVHKETQGKEKNVGKANWLQVLNDTEIQFIRECNFLVMHLSFIESILQAENPALKSNDSSNVGLFIEQQILPLVGKRDNFFFVVTTGRGRNDWWASLDKQENNDIAAFTLFRPIESLLTAVENSTGIQDDIELKYRIVKYLFGS